MKHLLTESITIDFSKDIIKQTDLMEKLHKGKIQVDLKTLKEGKEVIEKHDLDVLGIYRVPISRPGLMNKNGRKYTLERSWQPALDQGMGEGSLGLLNHPKTGEAPDVEKVCCVWRNHKAELGEDGNSLIKADMYLLNDKKGNGDLIEAIIKAGGKVDLSTRGYGEVDEDTKEVFGFDYKSCDIIYEGSYSVNFGKEDRVQESKTSEQNESGSSSDKKDPKDAPKLESNITNNKETHSSQRGDSNMDNKVLIRKVIKEAFAQDNKFDAYSELNTILGDIKDVEEFKDLAEDIKEKLSNLKEALSDVHQKALNEATDDTSKDNEDNGDAANNGTADGTDKMIYPDPETKIKDSDTAIPPDVHNHEVKDTTDTTQGDRDKGKARPYKAGGSAKAMKDEVKNGEVSHEELIDLSNTEIYEDGGGTFYIEGQEKIYVVLEDSDEDLPPDVHNHEVKDTDDTDSKDRSAYTDVKPASGEEIDGDKKEGGKKVESVNLYKLDQSQLIDTIMGMDEAAKELQADNQILSESLAEEQDYAYRLETYTFQAERVVASENTDKDTARKKMTEAVTFAQETQIKINELTELCVKNDEYIEKLEADHFAITESANKVSAVKPYIENLIEANPQLGTWSKELLAAKDIEEARTLADKYNSVKGGKIRLDRALINENLETVKVNMTESESYYNKMKSRGMI